MNKIVLFAAALLLVLSSCSKKTHPVASKTTTRPSERTVDKPTVSASKDPEPAATKSETPAANTDSAPPAPMFNAPMIVIDDAGKVVTPGDKLPEDIAAKVDYKKISHGFSLEQRKNLVYRFKLVPPKVLFVPENLTSKSAKGTYVIYKKKFWYWKKADGLFYLDETYYQ